MHVTSLSAKPSETTLKPNEEYSIEVVYHVSHGDKYFFKFWYEDEKGNWTEFHSCELPLDSADERKIKESFKAPEKPGNYIVHVAGMQDTWCSPTDYNVADNFEITVKAMTPWILVHGWRGKSSDWEKWVGTEGFCKKNNIQCYTVEFEGDAAPSSKDRYGQLDKQIETIKKNIKKDYPNWDGKYNIIAHSQGGLDARYYISERMKEKKKTGVKNLVMIGTPNYGSATRLSHT